MSEIKLHNKGTYVEFKQEIPDQQLTSKDILAAIRGNQAEIDKAKGQLQQIQANIPRIEESIEKNTEMLKLLKKEEEWALNVQHSKMKAIVAEVFEECRLEVEAKYKYDPILTEEQNGLQKFKQLEYKIGTHKKVAEEIDKDIMTKDCFTDPIFENPWK